MLQPLITNISDRSHIRFLYLDTFYIDDPTLTFFNCVYSWIYISGMLTVYLVNNDVQLFL